MLEEENKALVRRYFGEIANEGRFEVASEIITPEHVEDVQFLTSTLHTAFPDFRIDIEDQIVENDKVVTRFTASGTHQGVWDSPLGVFQPTGRHFRHEGIRIFQIIGGKLSETWGGADTLSQLQQLGLVHVSQTNA